MQGKSPEDISKLMGVSANLANLNAERFRNFSTRGGNQKISKQSKTTYGMWCEKHGFLYAAKVVPQEWIDE